MRYFPVFLELNGKTIVILGGGAAAANKLRLFAKTHAVIRCVALSFNDEMQSLFGRDRIAHQLAEPLHADFHDAALVIAATESDADAIIAANAKAQGILVNAVDKTDLCDFITPSIVDRGQVVVAIGTEGSAPVLARRLREKIEGLLPDNLGALSQFIGGNRKRVGERLTDTPSRRAFWERVIEGDIGRLVLSGETAAAQTALESALSEKTVVLAPRSFTIIVSPADPDDLTLRSLRALQDADLILLEASVPPAVIDRARRDAARHIIAPGPESAVSEAFAEHDDIGAGRSVILLEPGTGHAKVSLLIAALSELELEVNIIHM